MNDKRDFYMVLIGGLLLVAVMGGGGYAVYTHYKQRGIRNNNPGNIDKSASAWKGKVPHSRNTDSRFEQFENTDGTPGHVWGIRALYRTLLTYRNTHNLKTVRGIINRWAPSSENNTAAYVAEVAKAVGKGEGAELALSDYPALVAAIIKHENGVQPYPAADINKAIALA